MQCTTRYLPVCSIPARMSRDGMAGPNASILMPFSNNRYYFDGTTRVHAGLTASQNQRRFFSGLSQPNTFRKNGDFLNPNF